MGREWSIIRRHVEIPIQSLVELHPAGSKVDAATVLLPVAIASGLTTALAAAQFLGTVFVGRLLLFTVLLIRRLIACVGLFFHSVGLYPETVDNRSLMHHWNSLHHLSGIRVLGPDAVAFAHAQFTTAFTEEILPGWHPTAWCNPKGKVLSVMLARARAEAVELIVPTEQSDLLAKRLPMFAIGRKVSIESGLKVAGCITDCKEAQQQLGMDASRGLDLERRDALEDPQIHRLWMIRDICAGLAWLSPSRSEQFLPQALGLEACGGLSYKKGCYPGQEVV